MPRRPATSSNNALSHDDSLNLSYEAALNELQTLVSTLESGQNTLDLATGIAAYQRGTQLLQHCQSLLADAEARIQTLTAPAFNSPSGNELA